jgi:hypothetical protein
MSENNANQNFDFNAVNENDSSLQQSQSNLKFGLNTGTVKSITFNNQAGKNNTERNAVDITMEVEGIELRTRIFDPSQGELKKGLITVKKGDAGYETAYKDAMSQAVASVKSTVKSIGLTDEKIAAVTQGITSFEGWAKKVISILPSSYKTVPVDIFLEYQWSISEGQNRTFLQLPSNLKGGRFICPHVEGEFKETKNEKGEMIYVSKEGEQHPFIRSKSFMESNKAIKQELKPATTPQTNMSNGEGGVTW